MLLVRVNPFEVYEAERRLRVMKIKFQRRQLVDHILTGYDLQPLVSRCEDIVKKSVEVDFQDAIAQDMMNSPRVRTGGFTERPFSEGLKLALLLLALISIPVILALLRARRPLGDWLNDSPLSYHIALWIVAMFVAGSFGYSYLASRIGRVKSGKIFQLAAGLASIGIVYWMVKSFE